MFIDRPHWKSSLSGHPLIIKVGMHLRHRTFAYGCWYRVERLNFRAKLVELVPVNVGVDCPLIEVSFEEVEQDYQPTLLAPVSQTLKPSSQRPQVLETTVP